MKKLYFTITALALFSLAMNAQVDLNSGLVGYYPFNGTANDATGNGNNGIVFGPTLTADRFGHLNSAYSFNGDRDYIRVENPVGLCNQNYSYSVWVRLNTLPTTYGCSFVLDLGTGIPGSVYGETLALNNAYPESNQSTGWSFSSECTNTNATRAVTTSGSLPAAESWVNVVIIRDSVSLSLYENGNLKKSIPTVAKTVYYENPNYLIIGGRTQLLDGFFIDGTIDDLRFYNRTINKDEISALYNESICYQSVTVTDTLVINLNKTSFNPIRYANSIKIYPNPANDIITINYGNYNTLAGYTIKLVNTIGQTVFTSPIDKQESTINLAGMVKGLYFVHLIDAQNNTTEVRKIILK